MSSLCKWLIAAGLGVALSPTMLGADKAALVQRLHNAAESSSIDDPALKPWHLKLSVQLYDQKGNPSERGTIEEWWTSDAYKRTYAVPSYSATEISVHDSVYRSKGQPTVPYLLDAALRLVVHPIMAGETVDNSVLKMQTQSFGKLDLDCIILSQRGHTPIPLFPGAVPTYCLDPGMDQLRLSWLDPEVSAIGKVALFQGRRVGVVSSISIYGAKAISLHVDELEEKSFESSIFDRSSGLDDRSDDPVWVNSSAIANSVVRKIMPPTYPFLAQAHGISGTVMLVATLEKTDT